MKSKRCKEEGQALLEFIITLPVIIFFVWYMMHINVVINKSIVGQKHARSQLFLFLLNHMNGPEKRFYETARSVFFIGVAGDLVGEGKDVNSPAPIVSLGMGFNPPPKAGANDDPGEPEEGSLRQRIRVRTAVGICTAQKKLKTGTGYTDYCAAGSN